MYVSVEVLAVIVSAVGLLSTLGGGLFAGFAWMLRRMDDQFHCVEERVDKRFDAIDKRFDAVDKRFDAVDQRFDSMDDQFENVFAESHQVRGELTEVKVAVARLEGPLPRLIVP